MAGAPPVIILAAVCMQSAAYSMSCIGHSPTLLAVLCMRGPLALQQWVNQPILKHQGVAQQPMEAADDPAVLVLPLLLGSDEERCVSKYAVSEEERGGLAWPGGSILQPVRL